MRSSVFTLGVTERLEYAGVVQGTTDGGESVERYFYRDERGAVFDVEDLLRDAGLDVGVRRVEGMSDRGDLLVVTVMGDQTGTVVLSSSQSAVGDHWPNLSTGSVSS